MKARLVSRGLRTFSIVMIVITFVLLFFIAWFSLSLTGSGQTVTASGANANLSGYNWADTPIFLNGEWDFYPGVYLEGETAEREELQNPQTSLFPIGSLTTAQGMGTYRLTIHGSFTQVPVLYLPNLKNPVAVYWNGVRQTSLGANSTSGSYNTLDSVFPLVNLQNTSSGQEHELLLSVNQNPGESALYKRWVTLGSMGSVLLLNTLSTSTTTLVLGLLGLLLLSGFIFMAMRPEHTAISLITLFDSMLIFRIIFGLPYLSDFMQAIFPGFILSDEFCLSMQIFFLMMGGVMGALLAKHLFDPYHVIPRYFTLPLPILFGILAVVFPLNLSFLENYGIPIILAVYFITFALVFVQYVVYWKREKGYYAAFQIGKTTYVGLLVFFDILLLRSKTDFLLFTYLYIVFFMAHLFIRLYDNTMSYRDVERLNQNLEQTVAMRTAELTKANHILAELSTRDPLTGAHNRLYMEHVMEDVLAAEPLDNIYLCMFDLDFFKRINDVYGHDVGDDQLKYVVQLVQQTASPGAALARMGGEEFVLLYTGIGGEKVLQNVQTIRQAVEDSTKDNPKRTTASFGLAKYRPGEMSRKDLLKLADRCLYKAKNLGRNRIVWAFSMEDERDI